MNHFVILTLRKCATNRSASLARQGIRKVIQKFHDKERQSFVVMTPLAPLLDRKEHRPDLADDVMGVVFGYRANWADYAY